MSKGDKERKGREGREKKYLHKRQTGRKAKGDGDIGGGISTLVRGVGHCRTEIQS